MQTHSFERKQFEKRIIEKAMKDEIFRNQLLENPKEVIELELGLKLPESLKIHVLMEDSHSVYLILPQMSASAGSEELTDADLAAVAGGGDGYSIQGCQETERMFCR